MTVEPTPQPERKEWISRTVTLKLEAIGDDAVATLRACAWVDDFYRAVTGATCRSSLEGMRRPWVARVTGFDPQYRFARDFLRGQKDFSEANRVGSRGVYVYYHLLEGEIYHVHELLTWRKSRKYYCTVSDGKLIELELEEVEAALVALSADVEGGGEEPENPITEGG
jgi:hypothetical protein